MEYFVVLSMIGPETVCGAGPAYVDYRATIEVKPGMHTNQVLTDVIKLAEDRYHCYLGAFKVLNFTLLPDILVPRAVGSEPA